MDLAALYLTNNEGETSELETFGDERHDWVTTYLHQTQIEKIVVIKKNEEYMKGLKIFYRDGQQQVINDDEGVEAETVIFEPNDELIGMTCISAREKHERPRQLGFTLLRNGQVFETATHGC